MKKGADFIFFALHQSIKLWSRSTPEADYHEDDKQDAVKHLQVFAVIGQVLFQFHC
jgi:hypothetical protein